MTKMITADDRLKAFALYTMAKHHNTECERFYEALARMLTGGGRETDPGYISDRIWGFDSPGSEHEFDEILKRLEISVEAQEVT